MKVSVVIPVYNVDKKRFRNTLNSLVNQKYKNFEVCISDGGIESKVDDVIEEYKDLLAIKYNSSDINLGISENTNNALKLVTGDIVAFLDHDDLLKENAISDMVECFSKNDYDFIYSDEEIVDESGNVINKFFKPDFSLDLLYSQNYICHFLCVKKELIDKVGKFKSEYDGAQDYDYNLRMIEVTNKVGHLPEILYDWLSTPDSTSTNASSKPYAQTAGLNALNDHLKRKYGDLAEAFETDNLFVYRTSFKTLKKQKIDIIIPMKDKWYLTEQCIFSIEKNTDYKNYQITIIDNRSEEKLTKEWLNELPKRYKNLRVLTADFEFNWSKLQNLGIANSDADVFVFLNNDIIIEKSNWLDELCSHALREDVGVVGPLLLYEDKTIQHAGVVIGLGGYADHIFKGMKPVHANVNFVSPMVPRNVTAVTGACMAISRKTLEKIGQFDENFIICGSDVEICLRAYENGLRNIYTPYTMLTHLESKSRDSYIPEIDFKMSKKAYKNYWDKGDPYFNKNLSYNSYIPLTKELNELNMRKVPMKKRIKKVLKKSKIITKTYRFTKKTLKKSPLAVKVYRKIKHLPTKTNENVVNNRIIVDYTIPEIKKINVLSCSTERKRINILIPSMNKEKVFGGIATAMKFFNSFDDKDFDKRIIVTDTPMHSDDLEKYPDYVLVDNKEFNDESKQVVNISDANNCNLYVSKNDIFIATAWWTAYSIRDIIKWQKENYKMKKSNKLLYFIQDYEPYFYPWSSRQSCADSTYYMDVPTVAIFNSKELKEYFKLHNYKFESEYSFDPILNDELKKCILEDPEKKRKKQIVVYGRPSVARNAFEVLEESLMLAFKNRDDEDEWKIISMGEDHYDAPVKGNLMIKSVGKLSLKDYANTMEESYLGISLMVSPHPSYPPLEMSSFGIKTITNNYENKDMSYFNENIITVEHCNPIEIAEAITKALDEYSPESKRILNENYINASNQFKTIIEKIKKNDIK